MAGLDAYEEPTKQFVPVAAQALSQKEMAKIISDSRQEVDKNDAVPAQSSADTTVEESAERNALIREDLENAAAHNRWTRKFIEYSWEWHLFSTALLFFIVLFIIMFGLRITYIQFNRDYRSDIDIPASGNGDGTAATEPHIVDRQIELKMSASGLEIKSQTIGLIVLAMSLAFFFLYIKFVYPLQTNELNQIPEKTQEEASSAPKKAPADKK